MYLTKSDTLKSQIKYDYIRNLKDVARTHSLVKNPINLTLSSKVIVVSGSRMYVTTSLW